MSPADSSSETRELVSRFISSVERRTPESPSWSASIGGLVLGGAMLYHVVVDGEPYEYPASLLIGTTESVTLSPAQTALLVFVGIGALAFAGWIRVTGRQNYALLATVVGAFVSAAYLFALHEFTLAEDAYPLVHSFRAAILALLLFAISLVSTLSAGSVRNPRGIHRLLLGPDPRRTAQWGIVGGILLVVAAGSVSFGLVPVWVHSPIEAFDVIGERPILGTLVTLAWFGLAALPGYGAEGLVSSWVLIFGPVVGGIATHAADPSVTYVFEFQRSLMGVVWGLTTGVVVIALITGTLGYLLGGIIRNATGFLFNKRQ